MEQVDVIIDGTHMKVSAGMAEMFKRLGEASEEKRKRMIEAMRDILADQKPPLR